jgi:predicted phosphate transport protein (TIGR00153 family)
MANHPTFSALFARSPLSPIQEHMKVALNAAEFLKEFLDCVLADEWAKAEIIQQSIRQLESEADEIKREIRLNLPRSEELPVSRSDLLELLQTQDKIPNRCQDFAGLCVGRKMYFPSAIKDHMRDFVSGSIEAVRAAGKALHELNELLETKLTGAEIELVEKMILQLNHAEHKCDDLQREVELALFAIEDKTNPVDVMFMYRLIEWIGDIADYAQSVGNRMLYLMAK